MRRRSKVSTSATAGWVDWYNARRLHGSLANEPSLEYEQAHYAALNREPHPCIGTANNLGRFTSGDFWSPIGSWRAQDGPCPHPGPSEENPLTETVIAAMRSETDRLTASVRSLSDDDLSRPSAAREWDVSQVVSHLGSGAVINLAILEGSLSGSAPCPASTRACGRSGTRWGGVSAPTLF